MTSAVVKRSIVIAEHKTSVSLEDAFWKVLKEIAIARGLTLSGFTTSIDEERQHGKAPTRQAVAVPAPDCPGLLPQTCARKS
jgi:predicted DNA-binding ribbon-helix-helix protein